MKSLKALQFAAVVLAAACCGAAPAHGALLAGQETLQAVPGHPAVRRFESAAWREAGVAAQPLYVAPVVLLPEGATGVAPDELQALAAELRAAIVKGLGARHRLAEAPSADTLQVRIALSGLVLDKQGRKLRDFTPVGLVVNGAKAAAGVSRVRVTAAVLEVEVTRADGERLVAMTDSGMLTKDGLRWDQLAERLREKAAQAGAGPGLI